MSTLAAKSGKGRKPGEEAAHFKTDEDTGKMVIDDSDEDDGGAGAGVGEDVEGNAYRETLTSVDGFTRGPNGKIKFNKDTKKRRREHEEVDQDVEMADADKQQKTGTKSRRKTEPKLGHEFKAKVCGPCFFRSLALSSNTSIALRVTEGRRRCQKGGRGSVRVHVSLAGGKEEEPGGPDRYRGQALKVDILSPHICMSLILIGMHLHFLRVLCHGRANPSVSMRPPVYRQACKCPKQGQSIHSAGPRYWCRDIYKVKG